MSFTPAQLLQLRQTFFDVPLMLGESAYQSVRETVESILDGKVIATEQSRLRSDAGDDTNGIKMIGEVAVIPLTGMLAPEKTFAMEIFGGTSTEEFLSQVRAAVADSKIKGILIFADSPGGMAMGTKETADGLFKLRGMKPMATFVKGYCASACYYIAAAGGPIYCTPTSVEGSIGSKIVHTEVSKMRSDVGIKDTVITNDASPMKAAGDRYQTLGKDHADVFQRFVNSSGDQFISDVATYRGVSVETVNKNYGAGEMFHSPDAEKRGLIDAVVPDINSAIALLVPRQMSATTFQSKPSGFSLGDRHSISKEASIVNAKVKALLFGQGLTQAVDASDETCQAAINAFFAGSGREVPKDDSTLLKQIIAPVPVASAASGPAPNVVAAHQREMEEAQKSPKLNALEAIALRRNLSASAMKLNQKGAKITEQQIEQALDEGMLKGLPVEKLVSRWVDSLDGTEKPINRGEVELISENNLLVQDAADAYFLRLTANVKKPSPVLAQTREKASPQVKQWSRAPMVYFAKECLRLQNVRVDQFATNEEIVEQAMGLGSPGRQRIYSSYDVTSDAPVAANRPGDFPNLLANLANKMLDMSIDVVQPTYPEWTGTWRNDLPDFKPAVVTARSQPKFLNEVLDAEATKELALQEELLSYIYLRQFRNKVGLTPRLVADDDLGAFMEDSISLMDAQERTINAMCIQLLSTNVPLLDGNNLFDNTNHGNDIISGVGAPPGETAADAIDQKFMAQKGVGGVGRISARFAVALIAPGYRQKAHQAWAPLGSGQMPEQKLANTDSNLNTYRGLIKPVIEPDLADYSTTYWYGFADPERYPAIRRAYFRGWGKNGRRERWYDPETKTVWIDLELRVGVAANNYRFVVRNFGS